jgi:predicted DNA-binding transcriptional regulator AlpA
MGKRLIREPEVCARLGCGKTTLDGKFIKTRRLRWVYPSERYKAAVEDEVDALVDELIAERDAALEAKPAAAELKPTTSKARRQRTHASP